MEIDFEKRRDNQKPFKFRKLWCQEQFSKIRKVVSVEEMSDTDLQRFIFKKFNDNYRETQGRLYNNTDNSNEILTVEAFIDKFLDNDYILSGYSCLYKAHQDSLNIGAKALQSLLDNRKKHKKRMEAAEYGSDEYVYYRVLQLTFKVLANSTLRIHMKVIS